MEMEWRLESWLKIDFFAAFPASEITFYFKFIKNFFWLGWFMNDVISNGNFLGASFKRPLERMSHFPSINLIDLFKKMKGYIANYSESLLGSSKAWLMDDPLILLAEKGLWNPIFPSASGQEWKLQYKQGVFNPFRQHFALDLKKSCIQAILNGRQIKQI